MSSPRRSSPGYSRILPAGLHRYIAERPDPFVSSAAGSPAGVGRPTTEKFAIRGKLPGVIIAEVGRKVK